MSMWLTKAELGFLPGDEEAERAWHRMGFGEMGLFTLIRPRSVPMMRWYFGTCRIIGENQDPQRGEKSISNEVLILAGHFERLPMSGGFEVRVPKSIAFRNLTHDEWMGLWPGFSLAMSERFGISPEDVKAGIFEEARGRARSRAA